MYQNIVQHILVVSAVVWAKRVIRVMTICYLSSRVECLRRWLCSASWEISAFSRNSAACRLLSKRCADCAFLTSASRHLPVSLAWCDPRQWSCPPCCHPSGCCPWCCSSQPSAFRQSSLGNSTHSVPCSLLSFGVPALLLDAVLPLLSGLINP